MKTSILHLLSLFLIVAFTASCGKNGSSSGAAQPAVGVVNPVSSGLNVDGLAAQTNLFAWYNSASEGSLPSLALPARTLYFTSRPINSACKTYIKIFQVCGSASVSSGTSTQEMVTLLASGDKKIGNDRLATALAPLITAGANGLTLVNVKQTDQVYEITLKNAQSQTVTHVIDTKYNSRLNPVYSYDIINGKEVSLTRYFPEN